jgi:hypothetical protein
MIELILDIIILIILCYVLDYFWLKSWQSLRDLKKAYKEYKKSKEYLYNSLQDKELKK